MAASARVRQLLDELGRLTDAERAEFEAELLAEDPTWPGSGATRSTAALRTSLRVTRAG
jgi:hypothetical protein